MSVSCRFITLAILHVYNIRFFVSQKSKNLELGNCSLIDLLQKKTKKISLHCSGQEVLEKKHFLNIFSSELSEDMKNI